MYNADGTPIAFYSNTQSAQYMSLPNTEDNSMYASGGLPYYDPSQYQYYYPPTEYPQHLYAQMPEEYSDLMASEVCTASSSASSASCHEVPQNMQAPQGATGLDLLSDPLPGCHPGYSIKVLIEYAIRGSPTGRMSLNDIYEAVERRFPILKTEVGANWRYACF
jgi:hypothetical protein